MFRFKSILSKFVIISAFSVSVASPVMAVDQSFDYLEKMLDDFGNTIQDPYKDKASPANALNRLGIAILQMALKFRPFITQEVYINGAADAIINRQKESLNNAKKRLCDGERYNYIDLSLDLAKDTLYIPVDVIKGAVAGYFDCAETFNKYVYESCDAFSDLANSLSQLIIDNRIPFKSQQQAIDVISHLAQIIFDLSASEKEIFFDEINNKLANIEQAKVLERTYKAKVERINALSAQGLKLIKNGSHKQAQVIYQELTKLDPKNFEAWQFLGDCLRFAPADNAAAVKAYNKSLAINPNNFYAHVGRGYANYNLKKYNESISDLSKAIAFQPSHAWPYYYRSLCHDALNNPKQALIDAQKVDQLAKNVHPEWLPKITAKVDRINALSVQGLVVNKPAQQLNTKPPVQKLPEKAPVQQVLTAPTKKKMKKANAKSTVNDTTTRFKKTRLNSDRQAAESKASNDKTRTMINKFGNDLTKRTNDRINQQNESAAKNLSRYNESHKRFSNYQAAKKAENSQNTRGQSASGYFPSKPSGCWAGWKPCPDRPGYCQPSGNAISRINFGRK